MKFSQTTFVLHVTLMIKNKSQREQALYFGERSEPREDVASPLACIFHHNLRRESLFAGYAWFWKTVFLSFWHHKNATSNCFAT